MAESSQAGSVLGASANIEVEIEVEMVPTRNLVVKEAAGWAKAEFTPEQIVAAVKKGASCVRDHLVHKAIKKGVDLPFFSLTSSSHYVIAYLGFHLIFNVF